MFAGLRRREGRAVGGDEEFQVLVKLVVELLGRVAVKPFVGIVPVHDSLHLGGNLRAAIDSDDNRSIGVVFTCIGDAHAVALDRALDGNFLARGVRLSGLGRSDLADHGQDHNQCGHRKCSHRRVLLTVWAAQGPAGTIPGQRNRGLPDVPVLVTFNRAQHLTSWCFDFRPAARGQGSTLADGLCFPAG